MVGAGTDSADYFVRFGGCEDEFYMFGGFFHDFQQGVESLLGDHVGFIQYENLVAVAHRGKACPLSQFSRVVYPVVAGGVDFYYIEGPRAPGR